MVGGSAFTFALCLVVLNTTCAPANSPIQFFGLAIGFTFTCATKPVTLTTKRGKVSSPSHLINRLYTALQERSTLPLDAQR
mmetsp:Transcript_27688/g.37913  ORF Transcript_27688/g.37913 Transcript_27688/m.37913 type:complete len:81 (-) Transcript_27688:563-805(-)